MCVIMKKLRFTEFNDLQIQIGKQRLIKKISNVAQNMNGFYFKIKMNELKLF